MPLPYNFTISDASPIFQYLPFPDGPIDASWNASYAGNKDSAWAPLTLGVGASSHRTTLAGASVQLDWVGTAVYLYGDASPGGYTITVDGSLVDATPNVPGVLFSQSGLSYRPHSLVLKVVSGTVSISNANITVGMGDVGSIVTNHTVQITTVPPQDTSVVLTGTWYGVSASYGSNSPAIPRIAANTLDASVSFPITSASAFYITGHLNYDHGPYHVTVTPPEDLGAPQTTHYNASSRYIGLNVMKHLTTGLNRTRTYHVDVVLDAPRWFDICNIVIFDTSLDTSSKSSLSSGAIAGISGGSAFLLLSLFVLLFYFRRRRTRRKFSPPAYTDVDPYDALPQTATAPRSKTPKDLPGALDTHWAVPSYQATSSSTQPPETIPLSHILHTPSERSGTSTSNLLPTEALPPTHTPFTPGGVLTAEDARFFNDLHNLNVPAADVATMMETRRAQREAANRMDGPSTIIPPIPAPPRYDFKSSTG